MIAYRWFDALGKAELRDVESMLDEAVGYDAEAGFSTAVPTAASDGVLTRHLLVAIAPPGERGSAELDRLPDVPVVAYLRVDAAGGVGSAQFVVRPAFRSHGIATLLFELLSEDPDGWRGVPGLERLRAWAHGAHPAAARMASRFGGVLEHGVFKTLRLLGGAHAFTGTGTGVDVERRPAPEGPAELVEGHHLAMAPGEREALRRGVTRLACPLGTVLVGFDGKDPAATVACVAPEPLRPGEDALRALLSTALVHLQSAGVQVAQMYVDALQDDFVNVSRELEFFHDQSDLLYVLTL